MRCFRQEIVNAFKHLAESATKRDATLGSVSHGRQRHWNIGGRRSSDENARIEAPYSAPSQKIYEFFISKW